MAYAPCPLVLGTHSPTPPSAFPPSERGEGPDRLELSRDLQGPTGLIVFWFSFAPSSCSVVCFPTLVPSPCVDRRPVPASFRQGEWSITPPLGGMSYPSSPTTKRAGDIPPGDRQRYGRWEGARSAAHRFVWCVGPGLPSFRRKIPFAYCALFSWR
jgi:hypothetical protein